MAVRSVRASPPALARPHVGAVSARFLPTWRSLACGFAALAAAVGGYAAARDTALFAVRTLEVEGAPPPLAAKIERTLAPTIGESLLAVDRDALRGRLLALPEVRAAVFDRAFPHTLHVTVVAEQPVAVVRRGGDAFLLSARGRVLGTLADPRRSPLPRIWLPATVAVEVGERMDDAEALLAARALGVLAASREGLPARVREVRAGDEELTFVLWPGTELRLADPSDVGLKLAVARRVLLALAPTREGWPAYVDLSVPARPVAAPPDPQVDG